MLLISILSLLFSNAVTSRRDLAILYNRIGVISLTYCTLFSVVSFTYIPLILDLHGGLVRITKITQIFTVFLFVVTTLILLLSNCGLGKFPVGGEQANKEQKNNRFKEGITFVKRASCALSSHGKASPPQSGVWWLIPVVGVFIHKWGLLQLFLFVYSVLQIFLSFVWWFIAFLLSNYFCLIIPISSLCLAAGGFRGFLQEISYSTTKILNKMGEQFNIIEYLCLLLFIIMGAVFFFNIRNDFVSVSWLRYLLNSIILFLWAGLIHYCYFSKYKYYIHYIFLIFLFILNIYWGYKYNNSFNYSVENIKHSIVDKFSLAWCWLGGAFNIILPFFYSYPDIFIIFGIYCTLFRFYIKYGGGARGWLLQLRTLLSPPALSSKAQTTRRSGSAYSKSYTRLLIRTVLNLYNESYKLLFDIIKRNFGIIIFIISTIYISISLSLFIYGGGLNSVVGQTSLEGGLLVLLFIFNIISLIVFLLNIYRKNLKEELSNKICLIFIIWLFVSVLIFLFLVVVLLLGGRSWLNNLIYYINILSVIRFYLLQVFIYIITVKYFSIWVSPSPDKICRETNKEKFINFLINWIFFFNFFFIIGEFFCLISDIKFKNIVGKHHTNPYWPIVHTTIPKIDDYLQPIETKRLVIRVFKPTDIQEYYENIRSNPGAMSLSKNGVDRDIEYTKNTIFSESTNRLPPFEDKGGFKFGVFFKQQDGSLKLIGEIGVHHLFSETLGFPEIGCKFNDKYWGKGIATEAVAGFVDWWWKLPRKQVWIKVHPGLGFSSLSKVKPEGLYAIILQDNFVTLTIANKVKFEVIGPIEGLNNNKYVYLRLTKENFLTK